MDKKSTSKGIVIFFVILIALVLLNCILKIQSNLCSESGCHQIRTEGSQWCSHHEKKETKEIETSTDELEEDTTDYEFDMDDEQYVNQNKEGESNSTIYHNNSTDSGNETSTNNYIDRKKDYGSRYMDSYDVGYEDVYMDDDYDLERYENDYDYALGVDDAMEDTAEEFGDEW